MGIISALLSRLLKASPFSSESLDNLAEIMHVTRTLKKTKLDRYYKARLRVGGMAFLDRIFFDANYFDTLLADEVLAVAAHELTHLKKKTWNKEVLSINSSFSDNWSSDGVLCVFQLCINGSNSSRGQFRKSFVQFARSLILRFFWFSCCFIRQC